MSFLEAKNLSFSSRSGEIIHDVSLSIEKGSSTVFIGHSGSGKSTLLKLVAGLLVPSSGTMLFEGKDIELMSDTENENFRKRSAFVFQDSALWANQTIFQNLSLPLELHFPKMKYEERLSTVQEICSMVNFTKALELRPANLSAGEQKLVAFARAMICKPELLFLDEVTASLDKKNVERVITLLHEFVEQGNTLVYVSHNSTMIAEFQGKMIYIEDGKVKDEI